MALILSLETSTSVCSVALHKNASLMAVLEVHVEQSHASKLALLIEQIRQLTGTELKEVEAVCISSGPGSYTGLRIGTSTAKGLCYALGVPLIAVNTLELMAFQMMKMNTDNRFLCPMIDARRMEVYCLLTDASLGIIEPVEAKIIDHDSFRDHLNANEILFFGNGAPKCAQVIQHPNAKFIEHIHPSASALGNIAFQKFERQEFEDLMHFEPYYLKEFRVKAPVNKPAVGSNKL